MTVLPNVRSLSRCRTTPCWPARCGGTERGTRQLVSEGARHPEFLREDGIYLTLQDAQTYAQLIAVHLGGDVAVSSALPPGLKRASPGAKVAPSGSVWAHLRGAPYPTHRSTCLRRPPPRRGARQAISLCMDPQMIISADYNILFIALAKTQPIVVRVSCE